MGDGSFHSAMHAKRRWQLFWPFMVAFICCLVLEIILALPPITSFWNQRLENPLARKLEQLERGPKQPIDILALGTSRTDNGFAATVLSQALPHTPRIFNMGLPASRYAPLNAYLHYHLRYVGKPKLVLLEASDLLLNPQLDSYNSTLYFQALTHQHPEFILPLLQQPWARPKEKGHILLSWASRLFRFRSVLSPLHWRTLPPIDKDTGGLSGWHPRTVDKRMNTPHGIQNSVKNEIQFALGGMTHAETRELDRLLRTCQQHHIPVVLISWPNHPAYQAAFQQHPMASNYLNAISALQAHYHLPFVQLEIPAPNNFANTRHLSRHGAQVATTQLAGFLKQQKQLMPLRQP